MEHLIDIRDLTKREVNHILKKAKTLKGIHDHSLENKAIAMIFFKPSTRTRLSFEVAMTDLGGHAVYFSPGDSQISRGETISDTIKVLSEYVDAAVFRVFDHKILIEMAEHATIPIINGLSDLLHPCQALSDLFTIKEKKGDLEDLKLVFVGDGTSNVCHSLINGTEKVDMDITVSSPKKYKPLIGGIYDFETSPKNAVKNADIIYTDTWVSMGQEKLPSTKNKIKALKPYQVNRKLVSCAKPDVMLMHCLPAHRGFEITNEMMDGKRSVVWKQAANRIPVQKAILYLLIK